MNIVDGFLQASGCDDDALERFGHRWYDMHAAVRALARGVATRDLYAAQVRLLRTAAGRSSSSHHVVQTKLHLIDAALRRAQEEEDEERLSRLHWQHMMMLTSRR